MRVNEVLQIIRLEVDAARNKGLTDVSLLSLSTLIEEVDLLSQQTPDGVGAQEAQLERFKSALAKWQGDLQRDHDADLVMLRATIDTGLLALKSALLINGGAAVAFLTFIGSAMTRLSSLGAKLALASALEFFVWGVLVTGVGTGFAYFCQAAFGGEFGKHSDLIGQVTRVIAILFTLGSFLFFFLGSRAAISAFSGNGF